MQARGIGQRCGMVRITVTPFEQRRFVLRRSVVIERTLDETPREDGDGFPILTVFIVQRTDNSCSNLTP